MNTMTIVGVLIGAALAVACWLLGWYFGRKWGRDEGWIDCMLSTAKADRARRDARGRFKNKEAKP